MICRTFFFLSIFWILLCAHVQAQQWKVEYVSNMEQGASYVRQDNHRNSLPFFEKAYTLSESENDTSLFVKAGISYSISLLESDNPRKAESILLELNPFLSDKIPSQLRAEQAYYLASAYYRQGQYQKTVNEYERGLLIANPDTDPLIYARLNLYLANTLIVFAEYQRAIDLSTKAISIFNALDNKHYISKANLIAYLAYLYDGNLSAGEPHLLESFQIANEINDLSLLRDSYLYLSDYYRRIDSFSRAITFGEKGLELTQQLGNPEYSARYYNALGSLYYIIEEPERALSYNNRAYAYYESVGNRSKAIEALIKIGLCLSAKGDYKEAEPLFEEVLDFYKISENVNEKAISLIMVANVKRRVNRELEAFEHLQEALDISNTHNIKRTRFQSLEAMVQLNDSIVSEEEKLVLSKELYNYSRIIEPSYHLSGFRALSRAYHNLGSDSAFYYSERALELIEKKRLSFAGGKLKANLFSDYAPYYNEVGSWYASKKKNYSKAFELIEASKARALLDQLAINEQRDRFRIGEVDQVRLLELQKTVDRLYRAREESANESEVIILNNEITDAELAYEVAIESISANNAELSSFLYPKTLSLKQVQGLADSETAIIEYAFTDDKLLIFVITKNDVFYHEIEIDKDAVKDQVNDFRNAIISQAPVSELSVKSDSLTSYLFNPLLESLAGINKLVIVPDGPISFLPFESLLTGNQYLVQDYTIKYLPSVSVFNYIQSPLRKTSRSLLAFAGSGFINGTDLSGSSTQTSFASLPYTLIEVDSIATNFDNSTILKNDEVTEAALKSLDLSAYKFLHFATHGDINEATPSQSGLLLSKKSETEVLFGEDGYLNASEIASLNLMADMVVLSACNTGMGKILNGEGLLGLQRSFLAAGASSVVASLWSIYDRSTPLFMRYFYSNLVEYEEKEVGLLDKFMIWADWYKPKLVDHKTLALRDTKLQMIDHPYYNHPVHWASFVITGK